MAAVAAVMDGVTILDLRELAAAAAEERK